MVSWNKQQIRWECQVSTLMNPIKNFIIQCKNCMSTDIEISEIMSGNTVFTCKKCGEEETLDNAR